MSAITKFKYDDQVVLDCKGDSVLENINITCYMNRIKQKKMIMQQDIKPEVLAEVLSNDGSFPK